MKTLHLRTLAFTCIALAGASAVPAYADSCEFSAERTASIAGGGIRKVVVAAGAGKLTVRGETGADGVKVNGRACASSQELLDAIAVETRRDGDTAYVKTVIPESSAAIFGFGRSAHLDLQVLVPKGALLDVADSSGDLQVGDVQSATIDDSSGAQDVFNIAGDLDITDSSGELQVRNVGGNVRLEDSSGEIDVVDVKGDVVVTQDSSGEVTIRKVAGKVHVISDSSGGIEISDVQRDVTIDEDSSGGIDVRQVGGNFTVGHDGSGGIRYNDVRGSVRVPGNMDDE